MSKEAALVGVEHNEGESIIESPFQKDKVEAAFARILSANGIEIALEVGKIKPEFEKKFKEYITRKDLDLENLRARKEECVSVLMTILKNDTAGKLQHLENTFKSFDREITTKIDRLKKKLKITEPEKAIHIKNIPVLVAEEIPVDEPEPLFPPIPEDIKDEPEAADESSDKIIPAIVDANPIFDEKIEHHDQNSTDIKPAEVTKEQPEAKNTKNEKKLHITNIGNLTTFIKDDFPKIDKKITPREGKYILNATISILENASHEAKSKGKEEISALIALASEFEEIMEKVETKDIRENSKANLAQDLLKELTLLKRALTKKLDEIEKQTKALKEIPTLNTFDEVETFLTKDLVKTNITTTNIIELSEKISRIVSESEDKIQKGDESAFKAFGEKLYIIEKKLEGLLKTKKMIQNVEQEDFVRAVLDTFKPIFSKIDSKIANKIPNSKERPPIKITSVKGIIHFVTKGLSEITDEELKDREKEINSAFTSEFDKLREGDEPSLLILRAEALRLQEALKNAIFQDKKAEFIKTLSKDNEAFIEAIKRKSEPLSTPKENPASNRATPDQQTPDQHNPQTQNESNIEDLIDNGNNQFPERPSAEIKKDKNFNIWLQKIHNRAVKEEANLPSKTWVEWYAVFKEQKTLLDKIDKLRSSPEIEEKIYGKTASPEEMSELKRIKREVLSFEMLLDEKEKHKLEKIIEQDELIKSRDSAAKALEQEKVRIEKEYESDKMNLSEEVVFKALYGDQADSKRLDDFEGFLIDMSLNYDYYKTASKEEDSDELADMFRLYSKGKESPYKYQSEKLSKTKKFLNKVKFMLGSSESDYDDKQTFMRKIKALRDAGVLKSQKSEGIDTEKNIKDLMQYVKLIKNHVQNNGSIKNFLDKSTDDREKRLFLEVFPKYTKSITENHRIQSSAKSLATKTEIFEKIDSQIKNEQDTVSNLKKQHEEALVGTEDERAEFEDLMNQELADSKLEQILEKIEERKLDASRLQKLNIEFSQVKEEYAEPSLYRRVSLKLSKEEVALVLSGKNIEITSESLSKYEDIFESDDFSQKEKLDFVEAALKALKLKTSKLTLATDTVERIEINKLIKYFEEKKLLYK